MKKTLNEFYAIVPKLLGEFMHTKESQDIGNPFDSVKAGSPLVVKDDIALRFYEALLLSNTHFVPGKKPAIGMAIGNLITGKGEKEFITINSHVMFTNIAYLHMSRIYESRLVAWKAIKEKMHEHLIKFLELLKGSYEHYGARIPLNKFYAAYGSLHTDLPDPDFISNLKMILGEIKQQGSDPMNGAFYEIGATVVSLCEPFITLAKEIYELRSVFNNKGHLMFHDEHLGMSAPSFSGEASWVQLTSDDIAVALPSSNNLSLLTIHAGKSPVGISKTGVDTTFDKSISFLVPLGALYKLQRLVDSKSGLVNTWDKFSCLPADTQWQIKTKVNSWWKLVHDALLKDVKDIIIETVHGNILGLQLDMSSEDGQVIVRPVVCQTFIDYHQRALPEYCTGDPVVPNFESFMHELNGRYFQPPSIFDLKEEGVGV